MATNTKTLTANGYITDYGTGYYLNGMKLKTPQAFNREFVYTKTDFNSMTGKSQRDTVNKKERFHLHFQNLTQDQVQILQDIVSENEVVSFVLNHKAMLNISTSVFPFIGAIVYDTVGETYLASLDLDLIEEE